MTKKKKIILVPQAGLGNRMRVISSCIHIAKRDDRDLVIAWPINEALGCDIKDIFDHIGFEYKVPPKWAYLLLTKIYRPGATKRFFRVYKILSNLFFDSTIFDDDIIQDGRLNKIKVNSNDSTLLVASCLAFGDQTDMLNFHDYLKNESNKEYFKLYNFNKSLKDEFSRQYKKIGEQYVGIHIRRTDHVVLMRRSPVDNYIAQIDRVIFEKPTQKFFLSTDDELTKKALKLKYEDSIYTVNYELSRDSKQGIYGAVIEMLLLSKSQKIICSIISSYSTAAILMGDIDEVIYV